jgi:DNA-binding transcriptional LysR family regulator
MTLEQLRIFVAVAEREHVTRAAQALNLTQSAVSAAVRALEAEHGVEMFDRIGRGIALTEAGRLFLTEARAVLDRAASAELALAELSGLQRGSLHIHASQTIVSYWLPQRLVRFRAAHPGIVCQVSMSNTYGVARAVEAGDAELGLIEGEVEQPDLLQRAVARDRLVIIAASKANAAGRRKLTAADLAGLTWIVREEGSGTRSEFVQAMRRVGLAPEQLQIGLELPSNEAVRAAVEDGAGAAMVSELVARPGIEAGRLRKLAFPPTTRAFSVLRHYKRYLSKAASAMLDLLSASQGQTPRGAPGLARKPPGD